MIWFCPSDSHFNEGVISKEFIRILISKSAYMIKLKMLSMPLFPTVVIFADECIKKIV